MSERLILHEDPRSGNCYKIRLTAALLALPVERRCYDIMRGDTRTPEFLTHVNAAGHIPVLQIGEGDTARFLPGSNAACCYLADGSHLMPTDRFERADMLRWLFFEQHDHQPNVATLRFWLAFLGEANLSEFQRGLIPAKRAGGEDALRLMDEHLAHHAWLAGDGITLADTILYAYTHVAEAGGFRLHDYHHICGWLKRITAQPGYVAFV